MTPATDAFGRYRIVGRIAAGGMGEVYRAIAIGPGGVEKPVALKVMKPFLSDDPAFVRMFEEESKVAFLLVHGNVVQTYDVGKIDDRWFIAMELVDGTTLDAILDRCRTMGQPLAHRHAIYVAVEALRGLDYAQHAKDARGRTLGVVHRDISPGNLFVSRAGEVKVGDFGIALSSLGSRHTQAGTVKGKIAYMAPEQCRGEALDGRVDVYSMGVVLYEALTLRRPFVGSGPETIPAILAGDFPTLRSVNADIPVTLEAIVLSAMAKEREKRPASAHALLEALEDFALRAGWSLSSSAFAEFVERVSGEPPAPEVEDRFLELTLGTEIERVEEKQFSTKVERPKAKAKAGTTAADSAPQEPARRGSAGSRAALIAVATLVAIGIVFLGMTAARMGAGGADATATPAAPATVAAAATDSATLAGTDSATAPVAAPDSDSDSVSGTATATATDARPAARDPWAEEVPPELAALRSEVVVGRTQNWRDIMRYALGTKDPKGFLLAGHAYFLREWHANALEFYGIALEGGERGTVTGDLGLRGDPELLPHLVFLLRSARYREDVGGLIERVWAAEAIPALDQATRSEDPDISTAALALLARLRGHSPP